MGASGNQHHPQGEELNADWRKVVSRGWVFFYRETPVSCGWESTGDPRRMLFQRAIHGALRSRDSMAQEVSD